MGGQKPGIKTQRTQEHTQQALSFRGEQRARINEPQIQRMRSRSVDPHDHARHRLEHRAEVSGLQIAGADMLAEHVGEEHHKGTATAERRPSERSAGHQIQRGGHPRRGQRMAVSEDVHRKKRGRGPHSDGPEPVRNNPAKRVYGRAVDDMGRREAHVAERLQRSRPIAEIEIALSKQQRPIRKTLERAIKRHGSDGRGTRPLEKVQIAAERRNEVIQEGLAFQTRDIRVAKVLRIGGNRQKERPGDWLSNSRKRGKA